MGYVAVSYLGNWGNLPVAVAPLIGITGQLLPGAVLAHLVVSYPSGRLRTRFERVAIGLMYALAAGVSIVVALAFDPRTEGCTRCPWEPALFPSRDVVQAALLAGQRAGLVTVTLLGIALWLRWRRSTPAERRSLAPLWLAALIYLAVSLLGAFSSPVPAAQSFAYLVWELQSVLQLAVPVVVAWGLLSARLARGAVGDLVLDLGGSLPPGELRGSLARALGDPTLEVRYARDGRAGWVSADGSPGPLPAPDGRRAVTVAERDGRPLAALIHDPALDEGLVRAAAAATGMAMENERLQAEVRAQLAEVQASRWRIVEAGDSERRRVERNLHDGAQQRMVTLALSLAMLRDKAAADPALAASLAAAAAELKLAIAELRELARGIHPAILTEEGLLAAVEALADRCAVPVRLHADLDARLPAPVEATAYFVVAESLANVTKYARASAVTVRLSRRDGTLAVEVADDGVGGGERAGRRDPRAGRDALRRRARRWLTARSGWCSRTTRCCSVRDWPGCWPRPASRWPGRRAMPPNWTRSWPGARRTSS
jgi:signal transduction histidine kinase